MTATPSHKFPKVTIGQYTFENVKNFTYLGVLLKNRGTVSEEINKRIMTGDKAYYANSQLLKSALLSRPTKMKLYRTLMRQVVTYAMGKWTLNISDENALQIFERKGIREIYSPVCKDSVWRVRSNSEIHSLLQGEDIVRHVKSLRLSWLDHVECMESVRTLKCLSNGELFGVRRKRRPGKRWLQDVKDYLRRMRIGKWKKKAQEQNTWRLIVKEAKAHQGLYS
jgi:uncharacterized protein YlxP (DUF503 family)